MRPAIRLYWEYLSIVLPYFWGGARRGTGALDVGDQLVELRLERHVTLQGGSAEDLAAAGCLADPHPHATVREEEHEDEPDHQQRGANPDEGCSGVARHDQPGELTGAFEGVAQAGDRRRLALVHDLGRDGVFLSVLVNLELQLPCLDVRVCLAGGHIDDVDTQPFALDVELADAVRAVVGLPLQRRGIVVEGLAGAVGDLYRRGLAEERLEERDAVALHGVVDSDCLPVDLGSVLVQDEVARVVTWGAVGVVGVVERHCLDRQPGPVADLDRRAHGNDELVVPESGGLAEEETQEDDHEAQVRDDGSEGTPAEPVGIEVQPVIVRVGDGPEAAGSQDLAYVVHRLVGFGRYENARSQGRMREERLAHALSL